MENRRVGEILGAWRLDELIGSGGMGDVYRAHRIDGVIKQTVAVKILRTAYKDSIPDEAETIRRLNHPNIAKCFDSGVTEDGHVYLIIEYVEGKTITEYADQKGLSIHNRLDLFLGACGAIEYSHHHLIVHMDLKPGNILVNKDGFVKVIDFGMARRLEGQEISQSFGAFSGPYASPEQIQVGCNPGYSTDIYALGAVLYELLCGHEPFDPRLSAGELERQIIEETPRRPSDALNQSKLKASDAGKHFRLEPEALARMRGGCRLSEARHLVAGDLDRICLFALRKEPARRYRSVDDLRSDLERVLDGRKPDIARSGDPIYSVLRAVRRRPLAPTAAAAAITAVLTSYTVFGLFSASINASIEKQHQYDLVSEASLKELNEELRPKLATDPRLRGGQDALDAAISVSSAPTRSKLTLWDTIHDDLVFEFRRITKLFPPEVFPR